MKALIVDDERLARKELNSLLDQYPEIEILGEAVNADDAIEKISQHNPDLIFLDIQMPGKTGFEMLEQLEASPKVIFTTAYDEYALKLKGDRFPHFNFSASDLPQLPTPNEDGRIVSKYRGVSWEKHRKKWGTKAFNKHVGYFDNEIDAAVAYDQFALKLKGDTFPHFNFLASNLTEPPKTSKYRGVS